MSTDDFDPDAPDKTEYTPSEVAEIIRGIARRQRKYRRNALVGFLILLVGVAYATSGKTDNETFQHAASKGQVALRAASISSCERVNILRSQSNVSDYVSFNLLSLSVKRERALSKTKAVVKNGTKDLHATSADEIAAQAKNLTMTALTDCDLAVDHAATYEFPTAAPVGNPENGRLTPAAQHIVVSSKAILAKSPHVAGQTGH